MPSSSNYWLSLLATVNEREDSLLATQAMAEQEKMRAKGASKELEEAQLRVDAQDMFTNDLWSDLTQMQDVVSCLSDQLESTLLVHDETWVHRYIEGLKNM